MGEPPAFASLRVPLLLTQKGEGGLLCPRIGVRGRPRGGPPPGPLLKEGDLASPIETKGMCTTPCPSGFRLSRIGRNDGMGVLCGVERM